MKCEYPCFFNEIKKLLSWDFSIIILIEQLEWNLWIDNSIYTLCASLDHKVSFWVLKYSHFPPSILFFSNYLKRKKTLSRIENNLSDKGVSFSYCELKSSIIYRASLNSDLYNLPSYLAFSLNAFLSMFSIGFSIGF